MGKSKARKREEFFERGADAGRRVLGTEAVYSCPICELAFNRPAVEDGRLTLEHVPSRAVGGREILLTCRECNNLSGHTLEAAAQQRTQLWEFSEALGGRTGEFQGRTSIEVGGHTITADVETTPQGITAVPLEKWSDPTAYQEAIKHWKEHSQAGDLKFRITPRARIHARRTKVADLRTSYLAAFALYGYTYAFHSNLQPVRQQIRDPESDVLPNWWMRPREDLEDCPLILQLSEPVQALGFHLRTAMVVLPWIGQISNPYDTLAEEAKSDGHVTITGSGIPWPRRPEMVLDFQ